MLEIIYFLPIPTTALAMYVSVSDQKNKTIFNVLLFAILLLYYSPAIYVYFLKEHDKAKAADLGMRAFLLYIVICPAYWVLLGGILINYWLLP
jgi:hypothetical protein